MNRFEKALIPILVGDSILDKMTKDKRIEMTPNLWRVIRDKYLKWKINSLNTSTNEEKKQ